MAGGIVDSIAHVGEDGTFEMLVPENIDARYQLGIYGGGYGYTIGKSIGYGYVRHADGVSDDFLMSGSYELVVANERIPAKIGMDPFFDPSNSRVKA